MTPSHQIITIWCPYWYQQGHQQRRIWLVGLLSKISWSTPREIWILKLELLRHPRVWNYRFLTFDYQYELYRSSGPWFLEIELQRMLQNSEVLSQVKSQSRKHQFGKLVNSTRTPIPVFWMVTSPELTIQNSVAFSGVLFLEIKALNSDRVHIDNPNLEFWDQSSNFSWGVHGNVPIVKVKGPCRRSRLEPLADSTKKSRQEPLTFTIRPNREG